MTSDFKIYEIDYGYSNWDDFSLSLSISSKMQLIEFFLEFLGKKLFFWMVKGLESSYG